MEHTLAGPVAAGMEIINQIYPVEGPVRAAAGAAMGLSIPMVPFVVRRAAWCPA
ncbi:hypothetical protein MA13_contig00002-0239 [Edwardsiella piscicida]|uniref:Uncharacterized protein n=1 Tax=Edwardsiella anguillarum ET080813 TaxID=667120 RepID=A0A076LSI4_9GAMM|nr:Hypothetical protein ETEE_3195 [Edwardsiella anguillarum ET080813]GAJ66531.1 hypothetical protein MA13_contig00002-0239 [Edwardsiella piscicida]